MRYIVCLLGFVCSFLFCFAANATQKPIGLAKDLSKSDVKRSVVEPRVSGSDARFKSLHYSPNTVYKVVIPYTTSSYVEFDEDETVTTYSFNNDKQVAWDIAIAKNRLYLRPVESDAKSQFTVMTNKRVYFFEIDAIEPTTENSFDDPNFVFYVKFFYPSQEDGKNIRRYARSLVPNLEEPNKYNFNYTITGEESIFPVKIFDDADFTYFEFKRGGSIPAIFTVDTKNYEQLTNYRIIGEYLVVERLASRFTLRSGQDIVCVYNENLWLEEKKR